MSLTRQNWIKVTYLNFLALTRTHTPFINLSLSLFVQLAHVCTRLNSFRPSISNEIEFVTRKLPSSFLAIILHDCIPHANSVYIVRPDHNSIYTYY